MNQSVNYFLPSVSVLEDEGKKKKQKNHKNFTEKEQSCLAAIGGGEACLVTEIAACIPADTGAKTALCCT